MWEKKTVGDDTEHLTSWKQILLEKRCEISSLEMELRIDQECFMWKKGKVVCYRRIGDRRLEGCVELIGGKIEFLSH